MNRVSAFILGTLLAATAAGSESVLSHPVAGRAYAIYRSFPVKEFPNLVERCRAEWAKSNYDFHISKVPDGDADMTYIGCAFTVRSEDKNERIKGVPLGEKEGSALRTVTVPMDGVNREVVVSLGTHGKLGLMARFWIKPFRYDGAKAARAELERGALAALGQAIGHWNAENTILKRREVYFNPAPADSPAIDPSYIEPEPNRPGRLLSGFGDDLRE